MPIINTENSTQLEFGHGDIDVAPALLQIDDVMGAVCFFRRDTANTIGGKGQHETNTVVDLENTPVRMTFEKIESIDVIIRALEQTRDMMVDKARSAIVATD